MATCTKAYINNCYSNLSSTTFNFTRVTNGEFLDEFTDWAAESVSTSNNVILVGDFNLHINNPNDDDACNFMETTQVHGLHQNITFPTHVLGNTLDLIFSEANNKIKAEECAQEIISQITA